VKVHLLAPAGFAHKPSGGNVYDRQLRDALTARGWEVLTREISPGEVTQAVADLPSGALVLVDSLVASWAPEALLAAEVHAVPLVHMVFGVPGERELLTEAAAVVVTSDWTRRRLVRAGIDPRRVHVAIPGVERVLPTACTEPGGELLCVATLTPAKGQDVLLAALAELRDLDWTCTLAGSTEEDPAFVDLLRKQAADAGITDRVLIAGELSRAELHASYANADLLVFPSRAETYGMVVTEALVHGLPVVASAVGGIPEALGTLDGAGPGMLVRPDDPDALARSLRRWLEDPSLRRWLRHAVTSRRRTLPTWSSTAAAVTAALEAAR
jgi:glycosyltransferase involved in cell wall biosynthesis